MGVYALSGRTSDLMRNRQLLTALQSSQAQIDAVQKQINSGQQLTVASDNPTRASQIIDLNGLLDRLDQYQANTQQASSVLSAADTALGEAVDLLREAHTVAMEAVSSTASESDRESAVQQINTMVDQLQRIANRTYQGRHLFDGQSGGGDPFTGFAGGILHAGGQEPTRFNIDSNWTLEAPLDGVTVFYGDSDSVGAANDLLPAANGQTRLVDLNGALLQGIQPGAIQVSGGIAPTVTIDLSAAATLDDVVDLFNASAPAGMTMTLDASGRNLVVTSVTPGADITIGDTGGTTARDLGIESAGGGAIVTGEDLAPQLTLTTPLSLLFNGAGIDTSGIVITNGGVTRTLSFAGATTVQDILNQINGSGTGVRATIVDNAICIVNRLSGSDLRIVENGGATATQLGLRTFHAGAQLDTLNGGRGIGAAGDGLADLQITLRSGATFEVSLSGCQTVGDVLEAINTASGNPGTLAASVATDGGIRLTDSSVPGGSSLSVAALNGSLAAESLGLDQTAAGATLTGDDVSSATVGSIFTHLVKLRDAIVGNNVALVTRLGGQVEDDMDRMVELRGSVGAQAAVVEAHADDLDTRKTDDTVRLSELQDVDITEAVLRFQQLQSQLTASMTTVGKLLSNSLLDYL